MSLSHAPSGIRNAYLFWGVDAVAYLEGGTSYTYAQVLAHQVGETSEDIPYWAMLFERFLPDLRVRLVPVGSKATLRQIATALVGTPCKTAFVGMDSDADGYRGDLVDDPHVLYTWGYSWENDLAQPAVLAHAALATCPMDRNAQRAQAESTAGAILDQFYQDAHRYVQADVLLLASTRGGLFTSRLSPTTYVGGRASVRTAPYFVPRDLRARLREANRQRLQNGIPCAGYPPVDVRRSCLGHLVALVAYQTMRLIASQHRGSPSFSFQLAMALLAGALGDRWTNPSLSLIAAHHESQFAAAKALLAA